LLAVVAPHPEHLTSRKGVRKTNKTEKKECLNVEGEVDREIA
jgi:hypothetical protein